ncbi:MAG: hypothetical protein ACOY4R_13085 [Pseudomonadota bacterium]
MENDGIPRRGGRQRLLVTTACALLAGCSWFGGDAPPGKARPGADQQIPTTGTLPAAHPTGQSSQAGVAPVDETRAATPAIGSIVAPSGGQKAQKEAEEKAAAERDARERERAAERDAANKAAQGQGAPLADTPTTLPSSAAPPSAEPAPASVPAPTQ